MRKLSEARGDTAVFTFGRFNPPTTGHEKLIKALASQVVAGAKMYVYPSHSQNAKKDPLPHAKKIAYMKKMFPKYSKNIITSRARNVFEIAVELFDKGHKAIIMVVGSDRVDEFDNLLNTYNGEQARHGFYGFDDIKVISAGDRDPDAEGVTGMSASKMRAAAAENDYASFQKGLPKGFREGEKLFADVRKFMGLKEENWTFEEIIRDAYIRGEIFNIGEEVSTMDNTQGKIVRKGTNYVVLETNDGFNKFWISDLIEAKKITKTKQAKGEVGDMKGTQPAKYYSKDADGDEMSVATKKARARHFAKGDSRKPAPGDKGADTKPSQYTKKFKQMYGEQDKKKEPAKSDQEKERDEFKKLQKDKKVAALQYRMAKDAETVARLSATERKLTDAEKDKLKKLEKEVPKKDFMDRYGKDGESVYYATLTKMAKGESIEEKDNPCWDTHKQVGMKKKNGKMVPNCVPKEEIEEINVPAIVKSVISRMTHPKGYAKMLQDYIQRVKDDIKKKHSNRFHAAQVATIYGLNSVFPLIDYINKLVKKGQLPTTLMAQYDQNESYEIGKEYADHTKEVDPYSAPKSEKIYLRRDKKLPNLKLPVSRKKGRIIKPKKEDFQLDEKIAGLVKKSEQTGVPYGILKKSYDRGMAAWKGGHRPGATQQQWAFARVNSMLTGGKADPDLQKQIKDGGYKKKKKASKESVDEWFNSDETIQLYQERYGSEWEEKLNNTYERMLSKLDESCCEDCENHFNHVIEAAEYQGKKVKLNDPIRTSENPNKKFKVYVKNEKGKVVVVRFGDPNMGINRDDPERRKAFRARHNCDDPGPKWKARYWSCYQWRAGAKVDN